MKVVHTNKDWYVSVDDTSIEVAFEIKISFQVMTNKLRTNFENQ